MTRMSDKSIDAGGNTPLAVTMGDPAGIGLELTIAAWLSRRREGLAPFLVYGAADALAARADATGQKIAIIRLNDPAEAVAQFDAGLPVIDISLAARAQPGVADAANGPAVIQAIEEAVRATVSGATRAVVTNPIAKSVLYEAGFAFAGHTEFLADLARRLVPNAPSQPVMMIASAELNVVPLTIHIPLAQVASAISRELIVATVRIMASGLQRDFGIERPRIAVTGLNPHAGEDGAMGLEDTEIIAPAIAGLRKEGYAVTGPHPADTLFHAAKRMTYDAVLAMYHDQALIPVKTLAFDSGVNVTLGLPFVRTSPDHGTAFDIAGKGVASPASLIAALQLAQRMGERRALRTASPI